MSDKLINRYEIRVDNEKSIVIFDKKENTEIGLIELVQRTNDYYADATILENKILGYDLLNGGFSLLQSFQKEIFSLMHHCNSNMTNAIFEKKFAQYLGNDAYIRIEVKGKK